MKVVNLVLNNFTNDSRVLKTTKSLDRLGFDVMVVALHREGLKESDTVSGVRVSRIPLVSRTWAKNPVVQVVKFLEFMFRFAARYRKADVLHCNDLNALVVGCFCKLLRPSLKIVYDSHEFAINDVPGESKLSIRLKYMLERCLIRFPVAVINVSDSIAVEYSTLYKIQKPSLVMNCPPYVEQPRTDRLRAALGLAPDQKLFLYQGALSNGRGVNVMLDAFAAQSDASNVLVCMGYGPMEDEVRQKAGDSKNVFFHPAVAPDVLLQYTASADYGISFTEDTCLNNRYCLPNKLFEYLMAGIPVIVSNLVEMKSLVLREQVGVAAESNTAAGLLDAMKTLLAMDYSALVAATRAARKKYCWEAQERVLAEIYRGL